MHILFVDESGYAPSTHKAEKVPIFVLGGVVIPEKVWPSLRDGLQQAKRRYGVSGEIKWRYFTKTHPNGKPNSLSHLSAEQKDALRNDLLDSIVQHKSVRIIAAVVDTVAAFETTRINSADDLYHEAYKVLSERFQYFLQDVEREAGVRVSGLIVCDNRNSDQDDRLKEFHQSLLQGGTFTASYKNLIEGLFIAASHHSVGTQFADLVAGAVFRTEARGDFRFTQRLEAAFRRSPSGNVEGYGIVRVPKRR